MIGIHYSRTKFKGRREHGNKLLGSIKGGKFLD